MSALSASQRVRADELLDVLLDMTVEARAEYLARRLDDDPIVLREVESLLRATQQCGDFLATPARLASEVPVEPVLPEMRVGAWKLTRLIGRGGMGVVYEGVRAQRDFTQRVAIKLLRSEAIAELERFHAERRILARLEHPGIARLYDGGIAPDGRPYMVMELIAGEPITDYCTGTRATLQVRMRLFTQVCDAVAYAHRNLVVHRDLKPANILVTTEGQAKLLDFGVAKLIVGDDWDLTRAAAAPLTPASAAPEQLLGAPVTTATDIYTLGLLLFELLTGARPWPPAGEPIAHAMRIVLERPPPSPSATAAARPHSPLPSRLLVGDFDAIVAKALRKEPAHRYETVEALKLDVERAVRGEAVAARSGARMYQFGCFLRRYRWGAAAVVAVVLSLSVGLGAAAWQAKRAAQERDVARRDYAREEAVRYQLTRLFRTALNDRSGGPPTAKSMIDASAQRVLLEYRDDPRLAGKIVVALADLYGTLEDVQGGAALLEAFLKEMAAKADPVDVADARQKLAAIELLRGHVQHAGQLLTQADNFWANAPRQFEEVRLEGLGIRARERRAAGDLDGAIATMRTAIQQRIALSGREHRETAILYNSYAIILTVTHRLREALDAYRESIAIYRAVGLGGELDTQIVLANTGALELRIGNLREAETMLREAVQHERDLAGDSAAVAAASGYYGKLFSITDRSSEALRTLSEAADMGARYAGPSSPVAVRNRLFLGEARLAAGDLAAARATLTADHEVAQAQYGPENPFTLDAQLALVKLTMAEGHDSEARSQLLAIIPVLRRHGVQTMGELAQALQSLGEVLVMEGQVRQALVCLREAVALGERSGDSSWELFVARERLGEALAASGDSAARALLQGIVTGLSAQLGPSHPETMRAQKALLSLPESAGYGTHSSGKPAAATRPANSAHTT
jgi:non-specific serine/threonine protein kinase/serine/threonine-protein kinase